jgi:glutathione S-transferase
MLEHKGIEFEVRELTPGLHPIQLRLARFTGPTVPGLLLEGERVQGSRRISRALDRHRPSPPLFPVQPERRRAVEEAERWGEEDLQAVPRRLFRWATVQDRELRE